MHVKLVARPILLGLLFGLVGTGLLTPALWRTLSAQEPPPFPILYGGHVTVDGKAAPAGTELLARVDGYETGVLVEEGGTYRNLLVQPPGSSYFGKTITFHALGSIAEESDVFLRSGGPVFKASGDAAFDLHFQLPKPEPSPVPTVATAQPVITPAPPEETGEEGGDGQELPMVLLVAGVGMAGAAVAAIAWVIGRRRHEST